MKYFVTLSLLVISATSFAQVKQWSLEECISYAHENNLTIQQTALDIESTELQKDAAVANLLPNLNLNGGYYWNFGFSINPITNTRQPGNRQTSSFTLSSTWVVFDGMQNLKQISKSRLDHMAALYNLEAIKNDISINIASGYLQVLLNKQIVQVAENQFEISNKQLDRNKILFEAGSIPKGDYLQVQAQVASDEQSVIAAKNNLSISLLQLSQLLQLEDFTAFDILTPELQNPDNELLKYSPNEIYKTAETNQPMIKNAELRVESAEKQVGISRGQYSPTLAIQGQINSNASQSLLRTTETVTEYGAVGTVTQGGTDYVWTLEPVTFITGQETYPFFDQFEDNVNQYIGINLQVPIFNRMQTKNAVGNSQIRLEQERLSLETQKNNLRQTIQRAYADAYASLKSFKAAEKSLEANEENWEYAQKRYEQGAMNQFDYENTRNSYLNAVSQQLQSKYDYIFKVKVLEFYLTNSITL